MRKSLETRLQLDLPGEGKLLAMVSSDTWQKLVILSACRSHVGCLYKGNVFLLCWGNRSTRVTVQHSSLPQPGSCGESTSSLGDVRVGYSLGLTEDLHSTTHLLYLGGQEWDNSAIWTRKKGSQGSHLACRCPSPTSAEWMAWLAAGAGVNKQGHEQLWGISVNTFTIKPVTQIQRNSTTKINSNSWSGNWEISNCFSESSR